MVPRSGVKGDNGQPMMGRHTLRDLGSRMLDAVMPPRCVRCGTIVANAGALCSDCFDQVSFITEPFCVRCGVPFTDVYAPSQENLTCGACLKDPPVVGRARAVFVYSAESRVLVTRLKFADRTDLAPTLARWMVRAGAELLSDANLIVPVPLHRWRLLSRTYNQSTLLARHISKQSDVAADFHALRRFKATPRQGGLSARARKRNVTRAFKIIDPDRVGGKSILLIDDVLTTGATLDACARVLLTAGAERVDALVVGRVPAPGG